MVRYHFKIDYNRLRISTINPKQPLKQNKTVIANKPSKEIQRYKKTQLKKKKAEKYQEKGTKNRWVKQKTNCEMMYLNSTVSVNTWTNKQGFFGPYSQANKQVNFDLLSALNFKKLCSERLET